MAFFLRQLRALGPSGLLGLGSFTRRSGVEASSKGFKALGLRLKGLSIHNSASNSQHCDSTAKRVQSSLGLCDVKTLTKFQNGLDNDTSSARPRGESARPRGARGREVRARGREVRARGREVRA